VCVFPREMVMKNRTSVFTLAIAERGQCEKKAKKPAREFVTKELLIFVGTLRTSTFFYYMRARVSPSSLLQRVVVVCVCVCVCQGNIDL